MPEWFSVDTEGFKTLQAGKPVSFIARELIQNALDACKSFVSIKTNIINNRVQVSVQDDGKGFNDIADSYKLFGYTDKRKDFTQRGRFNIGEKQAIVRCDHAQIQTTCGTVIFNALGRSVTNDRIDVGTIVMVEFISESPQAHLDEIITFCLSLIPPSKTAIILNGTKIERPKPDYSLEVILPTVADTRKDGVLRNTKRATRVHLYRDSRAEKYLLEMGIPVCSIEGLWDIDIQQKVPLDLDRDNVSPAYLKDLFAAVLNVAAKDITPEIASSSWVRTGCSSSNIENKALSKIIEARYGDKVAVATPSDPNSIDDAIAGGYKVIRGSEMSADEWDQVKRLSIIPSSHGVFPHLAADDGETVDPTAEMLRVANLVSYIAKKTLNINVSSQFAKWDGVAAQYSGRMVTFNVRKLGKPFFTDPLSKRVISLILHEIAHEKGNHTESGYHEALSDMGAILALTDPSELKAAIE